MAELHKWTDDISYSVLLKRLSDYLLSEYMLKVSESEIVDSEEFFGSYDGESIVVKSSLSDEYKLFLVAHLFGHTVQWCYNFSKYSNIEKTLPINNGGPLSNEQLNKLKTYEYEASGYAISLMNKALNVNLAQWFSDWSNADLDYFLNVLSLKNKSTKIELKTNSALIPAKSIPGFHLTKLKTRYAY